MLLSLLDWLILVRLNLGYIELKLLICHLCDVGESSVKESWKLVPCLLADLMAKLESSKHILLPVVTWLFVLGSVTSSMKYEYLQHFYPFRQNYVWLGGEYYLFVDREGQRAMFTFNIHFCLTLLVKGERLRPSSSNQTGEKTNRINANYVDVISIWKKRQVSEFLIEFWLPIKV